VNAAATSWSATIPSTDALALANGTATVSAQVTDANGNWSAHATPRVTEAERLPSAAITTPIAGDNILNRSEAAAGVSLTGTVTGIAANSTFQVTVPDNCPTRRSSDLVNAAATSWSATIPSTDALALANGTATVSAQVTDANGNPSAIATQSVTVAETLPTVAITTPIAGDNILNRSEAATGVTLSGTATAGSAAVNGQTATITIVDSTTNAIKDTYTTTVTNGTWSVNVTATQAQALADGSYSIKASVSDAAGNAATTASQTIAFETI